MDTGPGSVRVQDRTDGKFRIQIMWFEVSYTSEEVRDRPTDWSTPWHMTSFPPDLPCDRPPIYPPSSMTLWQPGSSHPTNWIWWREQRHMNGTEKGWCDNGWKMGLGDTQQWRPQPLPVLHPQPDFAQCQLLWMLCSFPDTIPSTHLGHSHSPCMALCCILYPLLLWNDYI